MITALARLNRVLTDASRPEEVFAAAEAAIAETIRFRLFTILFVVPGGAEVQRIHSSNPTAYPVTGRKPMQRTDWGEVVMGQRRPWLGRSMDDIRWAFFDHALIASLGCGSCINVPVAAFGEVLGTINVLDAEYRYDEIHIPFVEAVAPALVAPLRAVIQG